MTYQYTSDPKPIDSPIHPDKPCLLAAKRFDDARGTLNVIDEGQFPFPVRRIYYLHNAPLGVTRAEHGHKTLRQIMICMHGHVDVSLSDGTEIRNFSLTTPSTLLYVPSRQWRSVKFCEPSSVLCVLASEPYRPNDYIHLYEDFLAWVRQEQEEEGLSPNA